MARGEWVPGITGQEVADKFGVSPRTVEAYSAEASRIIRSAVANDDDLRAMMIATLQTIVGRSMKGRQMRTAVEAIKAMAGITGVEPPKRHSVNVENDLASLYNLVHDGGDNNASPRS